MEYYIIAILLAADVVLVFVVATLAIIIFYNYRLNSILSNLYNATIAMTEATNKSNEALEILAGANDKNTA